MNVEHELENLGFSHNEIRVYLTMLRIGKSKAGRLAKESNLERTSTYNALKKLLEKGFVSYIIEGQNKVFYPAPPGRIVDMFKEKEKRAEKLVPYIKELKKYEKEKENIFKYYGNLGLKTVLNDILDTCKSNDEYLVFGSQSELSKRLPEFAEVYVARKDEKKLKSRLLIREELREKGKKTSKFTKARYIPKNMETSININIYKDKVALLLWSEIPEAVIIDNAAAAQTLRSYFEFMWENAKS